MCSLHAAITIQRMHHSTASGYSQQSRARALNHTGEVLFCGLALFAGSWALPGLLFFSM